MACSRQLISIALVLLWTTYLRSTSTCTGSFSKVNMALEKSLLGDRAVLPERYRAACSSGIAPAFTNRCQSK